MSRKGSFIARHWLLLLMIVLFCAGGTYYFARSRASQNAPQYLDFIVTRGSVELRVTSSGVVQPQNRLDIKPPIAGRIEDVLVQEGDIVKRGQILAWMSSTERAALIDAARARGADEVKRWEAYYKATPIIAPINGTIIQRSIEPGQTFSSQDAVLVMSDRLTIKAQVDETDIAQIKLQQTARITLDAYPDHNVPGRVTQVAYDATTVNNVTTYVVDVLPDEVPPFMRSGMTANVSFLSDRHDDILILPAQAIQRKATKAYVLLPNGPLVKEQEIEVGLSDGKLTEIRSGLTQGDRVVVAKPADVGEKKTNPFVPFPGRKKS